jgi:hypothetical protein
MRRLWSAIAVIAVASLMNAPSGPLAAQGSGQRARPRPEGSEQARPRPPGEGEQARPRPQPQQNEPERAKPRPSPPPPHVLPRGYDAYPRRYAFPVVSVRAGFYYHPYFGFYYGPYYGPFYPYPGPYGVPLRYSTAALRLRVKPVETEVYLNGYYAGIVDDFDGVFQRLYVPAGNHDVELRLDGYADFHQKVYVARGDTLDIVYTMRPLVSGAVTPPPPEPQPLPPEWAGSDTPPIGEGAASPYGILLLQVEPADARIFVDDAAWLGLEGREELAVHVPAGWHRLEVRRDGYQTFRTEVELTEGVTTHLRIKLVQ